MLTTLRDLRFIESDEPAAWDTQSRRHLEAADRDARIAELRRYHEEHEVREPFDASRHHKGRRFETPEERREHVARHAAFELVYQTRKSLDFWGRLGWAIYLSSLPLTAEQQEEFVRWWYTRPSVGNGARAAKRAKMEERAA